MSNKEFGFMTDKEAKKRGRPLGWRKPQLNTIPLPPTPAVPPPQAPTPPPQQTVNSKSIEFYNICDACQTTVKQSLSISNGESVYSYSVKMCKDCTKSNVFVTL